MSAGFTGRMPELRALDELLREVRSGRGVMVAVRGRRQVGKSRLVAEFLARADVPSVFFAASGQSTAAELTLFVEAARGGGVAGLEAIPADAAGSWETALLLATAAATPDRPVVVVIDELPYLAASEPAIEGILQKVWHTLERRAVLLVLIGSDISMMASLTEYRRPLYGRAREMVVHPLSVADVAAIHGLSPQAALDAYLVTGGFPGLALRWRARDTVGAFLARELAVETGPLAVTGERMMSAELPADAAARAVLLAIGAGERSHGAISARAGITRGTFERTLALLTRKGAIDRVVPYAEPARSSSPRYLVSDQYLRFWLRFIQPGLEFIARGRPDLALARVTEGWSDYRGRAIEPLARASIERMLPDPRFGSAAFVGSYWTRDSRVEVDLVGGQEPAHAVEVAFIGSVKWRDREPFGRDDLAALRAAAAAVPGAGMAPRLVGVSRTGFAVDGLDVALGPDELVAAWGGPSG